MIGCLSEQINEGERVRLVQDDVIGEPSNRLLGEGLVRDHDGEIFVSWNGDVLNGAQIDGRTVGLFL